jgi:hypothetical protein
VAGPRCNRRTFLAFLVGSAPGLGRPTAPIAEGRAAFTKSSLHVCGTFTGKLGLQVNLTLDALPSVRPVGHAVFAPGAARSDRALSGAAAVRSKEEAQWRSWSEK